MSTNYIKTIGGNTPISGRAENDYYATEPKAVEMLLDLENFNKDIWEPCCGEGHISHVLTQHGYVVRNSDIIVRKPEIEIEQLDFLECDEKWHGDIITNPPYKDAIQFIKKALELVEDGAKVAMFLKLQFLEGKERGKLYEEYPPKTVYVSRSRLKCGKNGNFDEVPGAVCYAWYIFENGWRGDPTLKWFN